MPSPLLISGASIAHLRTNVQKENTTEKTNVKIDDFVSFLEKNSFSFVQNYDIIQKGGGLRTALKRERI